MRRRKGIDYRVIVWWLVEWLQALQVERALMQGMYGISTVSHTLWFDRVLCIVVWGAQHSHWCGVHNTPGIPEIHASAFFFLSFYTRVAIAFRVSLLFTPKIIG